jgi:hypothetical protein
MTGPENDSSNNRSGVLARGAAVEVRNRFEGSWSSGFAVDRAKRDGYIVRRISDGQRLPATFRPEEVRPNQG